MKRAFTLIELLVVIAIVAILASLLFPVMARAKSSAKKTGDLSQLRQIATAIALYRDDANGRHLPLFYMGPRGQTQPDNLGFFRWPWLVRPYARSFALFVSPADVLNPELRDPRGRDYGYLFGLIPSWGYNAHYLSPGQDPALPDYDPFAPISESEVESPSDTVLLASSMYFTRASDPRTGYYRVYPPKQWAGAPPLGGLSYGHVWPRFDGERATVARCDGSASAQRVQALALESLWQAVR